MTPRSLGKVIRSARKAADLTQLALAVAIGVDPMSVSRWELGLFVPSGLAWARLCERLPSLAGIDISSVVRKRAA